MKNNINILLTIILYILFLIGVIIATQINPDNNTDLLVNSFLTIYFLMFIFIPITITIALIYLIKNKSMTNIIVTIIAFLSISWVFVVLYVAGTVMSRF
jgi:uncharacterized membrane protein